MKPGKFRQSAMIHAMEALMTAAPSTPKHTAARAMEYADALVEASALEEARPIMVWYFQEAPEYLRELSTHGGDEDWVALVPKRLKEAGIIPYFFTQQYSLRNPFGISEISKHELSNGDVVYIGAHA